MAKEKFLMVSLEEEQAQQLAEVLSNETSRKLINYLSDKEDATESALAQVLGMPISTVHYNLQRLKQAGLVAVEEFHYSKKGREVDHYKLANKYVIITPKPVKGIRQQLRNILPVSGIVGGLSIILYYLQRMWQSSVDTSIGASRFITESSPAMKEAVEQAADIDTTISATQALAGAPQVIAQPTALPLWMNIALWFLIGSAVALTLYVIIDRLRSRRVP